MQTSIEKLNTVPKKTTANKKVTLLFENFESICLTLWKLTKDECTVINNWLRLMFLFVNFGYLEDCVN